MGTRQLIKLLVVEDELITARALEESLKDLGYDVAGVASSGRRPGRRSSGWFRTGIWQRRARLVGGWTAPTGGAPGAGRAARPGRDQPGGVRGDPSADCAIGGG